MSISFINKTSWKLLSIFLIFLGKTRENRVPRAGLEPALRRTCEEFQVLWNNVRFSDFKSINTEDLSFWDEPGTIQFVIGSNPV